ncbi:MAG: alpha/beta hydrolase [Bacteroidales bacterium]|nr:alpha/beta hydrolase [Bacteroidales bacterium]
MNLRKDYFMDNILLNKELEKKTIVYAKKEEIELRMDIISNRDVQAKSPYVIFLFGGGFTHGKRNLQLYNGFFNRMTKEGFTVVSIDYRLGLKGRPAITPSNLRPLENAITMAVEDVFDATDYLLKHAAELNVDSRHILLAGTSAGALTSLSADWNKRNHSALAEILPESFQYAGVISFAGALFSNSGLPKYEIDPAPTMMFHGTKDEMVFYKGMRLNNDILLGSNNLADLFALEGYPYYIKRYKGMGHEIAKIPLREDLNEVVWFIRKYVFEGRRYKIDVTFDDLERECTQFLSKDGQALNTCKLS